MTDKINLILPTNLLNKQDFFLLIFFKIQNPL
jgi:hypothetical protein